MNKLQLVIGTAMTLTMTPPSSRFSIAFALQTAATSTEQIERQTNAHI